jgi:hypothetical protein
MQSLLVDIDAGVFGRILGVATRKDHADEAAGATS